jgi:hypothetical protein
LADRLAENGCSYVQEFMSERVYIDNYHAMVRSVSANGNQDSSAGGIVNST